MKNNKANVFDANSTLRKSSLNHQLIQEYEDPNQDRGKR